MYVRKVILMTKTELEVKSLTEDTIRSLGYHLYDIMFVKEAGDWFLRFFIEKEDGSHVDLDDCEKVSQALDPILDEKDPISESYSLEVSSCGLERHLREDEHYKWAIGKNVQIKTFKPIENAKEFSGVLISYDDSLKIQLENNKTIEIAKENIAASKILYNWEELKNE